MKNSKCLTPNCDKNALSRGLCHNCYTSAHRYVKEGKTTWKTLEEAGMALKTSTLNRGAFTSWLKSKL